MAMLFVEKVLSWELLVGKLYFSSQAIKKLFGFFSIRRHVVRNKWLKASVQAGNEKTAVPQEWREIIRINRSQITDMT